jgi:hypothetical protein
MSAFKALDAARAAGIEVRLDGKDLVLSGASTPPPDLLNMLRRHKLSIVALLQQDLQQKEQPIPPWAPADYECLFNERAALGEYDGELDRAAAEAMAFTECTAEWLRRHPIDSSPNQCIECGRPEKTDNPLLVVGLMGANPVWLHCGCTSAWRLALLAAGAAALAAMGIVVPAGPKPANQSIDPNTPHQEESDAER